MVRKKNNWTIGPWSYNLLFFWEKRNTKSNRQKINNTGKKTNWQSKTRKTKTTDKTKTNISNRQCKIHEKKENHDNHWSLLYLNSNGKKNNMKKNRPFKKPIKKQHLPRCLTAIRNTHNSNLRHCVVLYDKKSWQTQQNNPLFTHQARQWIPRSRRFSPKTPSLYSLASGIANMWKSGARTVSN